MNIFSLLLLPRLKLEKDLMIFKFDPGKLMHLHIYYSISIKRPQSRLLFFRANKNAAQRDQQAFTKSPKVVEPEFKLLSSDSRSNVLSAIP